MEVIWIILQVIHETAGKDRNKKRLHNPSCRLLNSEVFHSAACPGERILQEDLQFVFLPLTFAWSISESEKIVVRNLVLSFHSCFCLLLLFNYILIFLKELYEYAWSSQSRIRLKTENRFKLYCQPTPVLMSQFIFQVKASSCFLCQSVLVVCVFMINT